MGKHKYTTPDGDAIRRYVGTLEELSAHIEKLRSYMLLPSGRLSPFGKEFLALAALHGVRQNTIVAITGLTPGAVSQHYKKHDK